MKLFLTSLSLFLVFSQAIFAQKGCEVIGSVADSSKKAMSNITVKLYAAGDSLRTGTDDKGRFSFSNVKAKQITIHISAIGFKTYMAKYTIKPDMQEIDLGSIILSGGEIALPDVVIKGKPVAIKYMQDTVEYDARAFNVQDDDRVMDLLRQLPGVDVDEDENVTAMGKPMTKIRVNGQDFFTSNVKDFISKLPAGIVSKIQVIDDYGDKANFTGIKMGDAQKMLNVVTKPGMDNGQFGGFSLGGGTNRQIGGNGNGHLWKGSKQISGGLGYNVADNGAGLSQNKNASLNYGNKVGKTARIGANYSYNGNSNNTNTQQSVETVNTLGKLNSQLQNNNYSANTGQSFGLNVNQTTKKIFLSGSASAGFNNTESITNSLNNQTGFIKQDFKNNAVNSGKSPNLQLNVDLSKKLNKNLISGNFSFSSSSNQSDQNIVTNTLYYNASGALEKDSLLNRSVLNNGNNKQFNFGVSYGFMLQKDSVNTKSISINYNGSANITENDLQTYVLDPATNVAVKVDSLSIFTRNNTINQSLNVNYNQNRKKNRLNFGANISPNLIKNYYPELNSTYSNNYINISPNLNYSKTISTTKTISVTYNGRNNNPSIYQLQPVKNTRNLQNVIVGNPNLKSSFSNFLSASFNSFGKKSNISFQSGLSVNAIRNEIVSNIILIADTLNTYKQETRYENANGNYGINGNYNLNIPFKSRKYSLTLNGNIGGSRKIAILNNNKMFNKGLNFTQSISGAVSLKKFTANMGFEYNLSANNDNNNQFFGGEQISYNLLLNNGQSFFKTKSFRSNFSASLRLKNFRFGFRGNYNTSKNDNNTSLNVNTQTQSLNFGATGNGTVLKSYNFNFSANKRITKGYSLGNINPLIVNLGVGKSFLKSKALSFTMNVNDLLNEGNNVSQSVLGNSIIETRSNQIKRVVTFGLNYNVSRFGGKSFNLRTD